MHVLYDPYKDMTMFSGFANMFSGFAFMLPWFAKVLCTNYLFATCVCVWILNTHARIPQHMYRFLFPVKSFWDKRHAFLREFVHVYFMESRMCHYYLYLCLWYLYVLHDLQVNFQNSQMYFAIRKYVCTEYTCTDSTTHAHRFHNTRARIPQHTHRFPNTHTDSFFLWNHFETNITLFKRICTRVFFFPKTFCNS